MRHRTWKFAERVLRRCRDERGAEMLQLAVVVFLIIILLYGTVTVGLIFAAKSSLNQAAAGGARAGIVTSTPVATAEGQAGANVGWMDKGPCGTSGTAITCNAEKIPCPSNSNQECLKVTLVYDYSSNPLFPELPGLNLFMPSTLTSTNIQQIPAST